VFVYFRSERTKNSFEKLKILFAFVYHLLFPRVEREEDGALLL